MNWLTWWQNRKQFLVLILILAAYAALAIPTGIHFWNSYQDALANCGHLRPCQSVAEQMFLKSWEANLNPASIPGSFNIVTLLVLAMPFLVGMFVGVPLIAREYIENTNKLIWTQGVSRRRWLSTKLLWALATVVVFAGLFALITTWWSRTGNAVFQGRFGVINFAMQGLTPASYAIFATSLGIALGAWLKRLLPAIAIMLGLVLAVQIAVPTLLRPHYMTQKVYTAQLPDTTKRDVAKGSADQPPDLPNMGPAWKTSATLVNRQGQPINWANPPKACTFTPDQVDEMVNNGTAKGGYVGRENRKVISIDCLRQNDYHWRVQYQAADRYWKFQLIESGLYLALAAIPLTATYWLVLRRDA